MDAAHCFAPLLCVLYECYIFPEGMEGIIRAVKVEGWEGVVVRLCLENTQLVGSMVDIYISLPFRTSNEVWIRQQFIRRR